MVYVILFVLGLCLGSFVNALVWRLHERSMPTKKRTASIDELSITKGRSMCPKCKHTLGVLDLIPLISWLCLGGRCRYCSTRISQQYPAIELSTAFLFVLSYIFWPFTFDERGIFLFSTWLVALVAFMALIVYDLRWMLLPNKVVFPLITIAFFQVITVVLFFDGGTAYALGAAASFAIAGGLFYILFHASKGKWIGGGDVKLGYALGLLLADPFLSCLMLFTASLLGLLSAVPGLITKKVTGTSRIPFGPFLIMATVIVMLFGQTIVAWYKQQILQLP